MTKTKLLLSGFLGAALLATPVMAQEAVQEPGNMAFNYPDSHYLTGGYGVRGTPGPGYYYSHRFVGPRTPLPFGPAYVPLYGEPDYYPY